MVDYLTEEAKNRAIKKEENALEAAKVVETKVVEVVSEPVVETVEETKPAKKATKKVTE